MKYRFSFTPCLGDRAVFNGEPCETIEEAEQQWSLIANYTLYLHECKLMPDHSNFGRIEQLIDDEWEGIE